MKYNFPNNFIFGVADADLQVIGEDNTLKLEQSEKTMWYDFAERVGKDTPAVGIDRYHKWPEDIELMKLLGVKHYRTSISMSRTLHEDGSVNITAMKWYADYFAALKKAGITIYATLYHWELPLYLHKIGGWTNRETVHTFEKHVEAVVTHLNQYIEEYFILNEPWCASMLSYHLGIHAPGETNLAHALSAAHHLLLAQGTSYELIRSLKPNAKISTVVNTETAYPYSKAPEDIEAAKRSDGYFNRWFCDPLFLGAYPKDMVSLYADNMPHMEPTDMKTIQVGSKLNALGVNYYCGRVIKANPNATLGYSAVTVAGTPINDLNWPIVPEGLFDILSQLENSYHIKKMYITENGMALQNPDDDQRRIEYVKAHLVQIHKATEHNIPVAGYFEWTLMDNYEWAEGYRPQSCFGMIHVDRNTMKRTWKKSAHWYKDVLSTNSVQG